MAKKQLLYQRLNRINQGGKQGHGYTPSAAQEKLCESQSL
jgi:hypothetical protein